MTSEDFFTDVEFAALIGITVCALRNKISAGHPLPPRVQIPGCRKRLWPRRSVIQWLEKFIIDESRGVERRAQIRKPR